jgi:glycosyltransferase involved in cell wall biosynthesis
MYQFLPTLERNGLDVQVQPFFDDSYLVRLYSTSRRSWRDMARAYSRRLLILARRNSVDLVWLEKECWPWVPAILDPWLLKGGPPYVVDYDDATFHSYDQSPHWLVRKMLGRKIDAVMRNAALVIAGNKYLARRATRAGAQTVRVLPSVVDLRRYAAVNPRRDGFVVGWIGSPGSQHLLLEIADVLKRALAMPGDRFVTVGANFSRPLFEGHEMRSWREDSEVKQISDFDVGIMPVADRPFERGKCGYKLIQYMACGLPVIASPVGANLEIVSHGRSGFLASTPEEWFGALTALRSSLQLRSSMGHEGRRMVESEYSLEVAAPQLIRWLLDAAAGRQVAA